MIEQVFEYEQLLQMTQKVETSDVMYLQQIESAEMKMLSALQKIDSSKLTPADMERLNKVVQMHKTVVKTIKQLQSRKYELIDKLGSNQNVFDGPYNTFTPKTFFNYKAPDSGFFISFAIRPGGAGTKLLEKYCKLALKKIRENCSDYIMSLDQHQFGFLFSDLEGGLERLETVHHQVLRAIKEKNGDELDVTLCTDYVRLPFKEDSHEEFARFASLSLEKTCSGACKPGEYQLHCLEGSADSIGGNEADRSIVELIMGSHMVISSTMGTAVAAAKLFAHEQPAYQIVKYPEGGEPEELEQKGEEEGAVRFVVIGNSKQMDSYLTLFKEGGVSMNATLEHYYLDVDGVPAMKFLDFIQLVRRQRGYSKAITAYASSGQFSAALKRLAEKHKIALSDIKLS